MTAKARGRTGTAKGLPENEVTRHLIRLAAALPRQFTRQEAGTVLEMRGLDADQAEGVLQVLKRMPGLRCPSPGVYRMPRHAEAWICARSWALTPPRLNAETAIQTLKALNALPADELHPTLYAFTGRLKRALKGIGVKAGDLE